MGYIPIVEYVPGDACGNCWGVGKAFGDIPTPKRITMTGSGFVGGDAPLNDTFIAEQEVGSPCILSFDNGVVFGSWQTGVANSFFQMGLTGGPAIFQTVEGLCVRTSTVGAQEVTIAITDPPTPGYKFAVDQNFSPGIDTASEALGAANGDEVLRLANPHDKLGVYVRYEPDY